MKKETICEISKFFHLYHIGLHIIFDSLVINLKHHCFRRTHYTFTCVCKRCLFYSKCFLLSYINCNMHILKLQWIRYSKLSINGRLVKIFRLWYFVHLSKYNSQKPHSLKSYISIIISEFNKVYTIFCTFLESSASCDFLLVSAPILAECVGLLQLTPPNNISSRACNTMHHSPPFCIPYNLALKAQMLSSRVVPRHDSLNDSFTPIHSAQTSKQDSRRTI